MVMTASTMPPLGTEAPDFTPPDLEGDLVSPSDFADARALVVVFLCNHCPFVKHVLDGLVRLVKDHQPRGGVRRDQCQGREGVPGGSARDDDAVRPGEGLHVPLSLR